MRTHLEVYKQKGTSKQPYRWRKIANNGRKVSVSGEGFSRRRYAAIAARREYPKLPVEHQGQG
jgi:hypothetical protein